MKKTILFFLSFFFTCLAYCQTANFSYSSTPSSFCNPTTIRFTQQCSGTPIAFIWDFGNNTTSSDANPVINFSTAGTFNVKLTAIYDQASATTTQTITINPSVQIGINPDRGYICKPGIINFTATNNGNMASFEWDFGDGSNKVITTTNTVSHNYVAMGNYMVTLKGVNVAGCSDTTSKTVEVKPLVINATINNTEGCIPIVSTFRATPVIPVNSTVTTYAWNFGDGVSLPNSTVNINHTYNQSGRFTPVLTVTTSEGCTNTFTFPEIGFGTPPARPNGYPRVPVVCGSETPTLIAHSPTANNYIWDLGDGGAGVTIDTTLRHRYRSLGVKNIVVTPFLNGCAGPSDTFQITIVGVIANYKHSNTCADKKEFSFNNISQGNISGYKWNFGDDSPEESNRNASHRFPQVGSFYVKLDINDSVTGCTDTMSNTIYTANPVLHNTDQTLCKNAVTSFTLENDYNNPGAIHTWHVAGDSIVFNDSSTLAIKADTLGYFTNFVIVDNGVGNCPDTIGLSQVMLVKGPALSFTAASVICMNNTLEVLNSSTSFLPNEPISAWEWNFGESTATETGYQPAPHNYNRYGPFRIRLSATDNNGCTDTLTQIVRVNPMPTLRAIPRIDTLCSGTASTLIAFHNGNLEWEPATLVSCASCDTVTVNPTTTTWLRLKATSTANCVSTDSVLVRVFNPFSAGANPQDAFVCKNESTVLTITPTDKKISWSPSTGLSNPNIYSPVAKPVQTTIYTATLSDSAGCFKDSVNVTVHVKSLPTVNAGPDQFQAYNNAYTLSPVYSSNVSNYSWTLDNSLNCNNCAMPTGVADKSKTHKITVTSDSGCVASDQVNIFIQCSDAYLLMPGAFTPNNDGNNDFYYPLTRGIKIIRHFAIYNRQGQLIFQAKDFLPNNQSSGWNGYFGANPQMPGTYIYVMDAQCDAGETLSKKGTFVLMR